MNTEKWWKKEYLMLNKALIELSGEHLGYIPLGNLLEDFDILADSEKASLIPLMVKDGCRIRKQVYKSGETIYSVWVN